MNTGIDQQPGQTTAAQAVKQPRKQLNGIKSGQTPSRKMGHRTAPTGTLERILSETLGAAKEAQRVGSDQYSDLLRAEIRDLQVRLEASIQECNRLRELHNTAIVQGTKLLQQAVDLNAELAHVRQGKGSHRGQEGGTGEWSMPERQAELDIQAEQHHSEKARLQARVSEMQLVCDKSSRRIAEAQKKILEMTQQLGLEKQRRAEDAREHERLIAMSRSDEEVGKQVLNLRHQKEVAELQTRISEIQSKLDKALLDGGHIRDKRKRIITAWLNKNYTRHPNRDYRIAQRPFWDAFEQHIRNLPPEEKEIISRPDPRELLVVANEVLGATTVQTAPPPQSVGGLPSDLQPQYWMAGIRPRMHGEQ